MERYDDILAEREGVVAVDGDYNTTKNDIVGKRGR